VRSQGHWPRKDYSKSKLPPRVTHVVVVYPQFLYRNKQTQSQRLWIFRVEVKVRKEQTAGCTRVRCGQRAYWMEVQDLNPRPRQARLPLYRRSPHVTHVLTYWVVNQTWHDDWIFSYRLTEGHYRRIMFIMGSSCVMAYSDTLDARVAHDLISIRRWIQCRN